MYNPKRDYYRALGLTPEASPEVIRVAYEELSSFLDPGQPQHREMQVLLEEAHRTLADPVRRASYDRERDQAHRTRPVDPVGALDAPIPEAEPETAPAGPVMTTYRAPSPDAIPAVEKALARDPENKDLRAWLAFLYYSAERHQDALHVYQQLVAKDPKNPNFHYYLGNVSYKIGKKAVALAAWETAIRLDPGGFIAQRAQRKIEGGRK
ncbi:MAG: tetratricopeptide repeat protein [Candidatus Riflebacteria bacterium]|nr:tetratricopeptide repeat protein [Candidatus Riflebacteria bacterium]